MEFRSTDGVPRSTGEYGGDKQNRNQQDDSEEDDEDEFNAGTPENYQPEEKLLYSAKGGQSDKQGDQPQKR